MNSFDLPPGAIDFIEKIYDRTFELINTGIWSGIHEVDLQSWYSQFSDDNERYFAIRILDKLIYRSDTQTISMATQLFQRVLPDLLVGSSLSQYHTEWMKMLSVRSKQEAKNLPVRVVPIIREYDPPTKSGPALARLYKRRLEFNDSLMIWPIKIQKEIALGVKLFIIIDDFAGTGNQFVKFYKEYIQNLTGTADFVYLPLAAHSQAISNIQTNCPGIRIGSSEILTSDNNFFHKFDCKNDDAAAIQFYDGMFQKYLSLKNELKFGYGNLALTYAFEHGTPNCSLPLLWCESENFIGLMAR